MKMKTRIARAAEPPYLDRHRGVKSAEVTKVARQVAEDVRKVLEKETTKLRKANK